MAALVVEKGNIITRVRCYVCLVSTLHGVLINTYFCPPIMAKGLFM